MGAEGERFTYTASGMVTNIAARLCDLGSGGAIYLSETTAHIVGTHFKLRGPTYEHFKNIRGKPPPPDGAAIGESGSNVTPIEGDASLEF